MNPNLTALARALKHAINTNADDATFYAAYRALERAAEHEGLTISEVLEDLEVGAEEAD